jgi:hypothetical protein
MKKEFNIRDKVWIHIGERKLIDGRVVEIITLDHLKENHILGAELYIIELKTGIDDIYEVRPFDQISPDAGGPINLFRKTKTRMEQRFVKRLGMTIPNEDNVIPGPADESNTESMSDEEMLDNDTIEPTSEQIHAALERAEKAKENNIFNPNAAAKKPRKRVFSKRKKSDQA